MKYIITIILLLLIGSLSLIPKAEPVTYKNETYDEALKQCGTIEKFDDRNICRMNVTKVYTRTRRNNYVWNY